MLDADDAEWRKKSMILLDGAGWHTSAKIVAFFKQLWLPVAISAPNSYETAAIEKAFGALKRGSLNPLNRPFTKKVSLLFLLLIP